MSEPKARAKVGAAEPSVLGRMALVLNAFSISRPALTVEEVAQLIGASEATAYRYLGELCESGLLSRRTGLYVLGPKVIELEFIIRSCDPVMRASEDVMRRLAETTGCNVLLCNIYNETIVNVFHAFGREPINLIYTKGRPMPLFRGSQARAILSVLDRRRLKRIFERHEGDPDLKRIASDWDEFRALLQETRRRGYYVSRNELDRDVTGIAAPVFDRDRTVLGSLVLAFASSKPPPISERALAQIVVETAEHLSGGKDAAPDQEV
jgi:DNA-binding IclR family transcriptional regulator